MRQLAVIHKKYGSSGSPSKLLTGTDVLIQRKGGITGLLSKHASSKVSTPKNGAMELTQERSKSKDDESDESLGDINEKKFL
jgi:hypothetical protein